MTKGEEMTRGKRDDRRRGMAEGAKKMIERKRRQKVISILLF